MVIYYDTWLIIMTLLASGFAAFVTCSFIQHIYRSTNFTKNYLLPIYSLAIGSGLLAIHFNNCIAFNTGNMFPTSIPSIPYLAGAWFAAILTGAIICSVTSKKTPPLKLLVFSGLKTGLTSYAMFFLFNLSLYGAHSISLNFIPVVITMMLSVFICTLELFALSKVKEYTGKNILLIKLMFSLITAIAIMCLYIAFNTTINIDTHSILSTSMQLNDKKIVGSILSISIISMFLLAFSILVFYDKLKLSFLSHQINSHMHSNDYHDALTKLPNRAYFEQKLAFAAKRCDSTHTTLALLYLNLDNFTLVNHDYGAVTGDAILVSVAQRLQMAVRGCDLIARIGGDEFVALIEEIQSGEDVLPIIERIAASINDPISVNVDIIKLSGSIGIAKYPIDGELDKLLICADSAMQTAKRQGKNQFKFFSSANEFSSKQMIAMQHDLRIAIENNQFSLALQPIVDCRTHSPIGVEALIRWDHPEKGMIKPDYFMPIAERLGLISQINDWVVEESIHTVYRAKKIGIDLNISINLARHQFRNPNLVSDITKLINHFKLPANHFTFEIQEAAAIKNEVIFKQLIAQFKAANFKVALDDFGLHPFTLTSLQDLNIDELKLDKAFLVDIDTNQTGHVLLETIINLAHALNFNVVAEGVETELQRSVLEALGCNQMQGYLFSKPISEDSLFKLFKQLESSSLSSGKFSFLDYQTQLV